MSANKIFNKLMTFSVTDFPKSNDELGAFRNMLDELKAQDDEDSIQDLLDATKLHSPLMSMDVKHFPKTIREHMVFNGTLLKVLLKKLPSYHLFYPEAA
jgi:hypothetical protein